MEKECEHSWNLVYWRKPKTNILLADNQSVGPVRKHFSSFFMYKLFFFGFFNSMVENIPQWNKKQFLNGAILNCP